MTKNRKLYNKLYAKYEAKYKEAFEYSLMNDKRFPREFIAPADKRVTQRKIEEVEYETKIVTDWLRRKRAEKTRQEKNETPDRRETEYFNLANILQSALNERTCAYLLEKLYMVRQDKEKWENWSEVSKRYEEATRAANGAAYDSTVSRIKSSANNLLNIIQGSATSDEQEIIEKLAYEDINIRFGRNKRSTKNQRNYYRSLKKGDKF